LDVARIARGGGEILATRLHGHRLNDASEVEGGIAVEREPERLLPLGRVEAVECHLHAPHAADLPVEPPASESVGLEAAIPDDVAVGVGLASGHHREPEAPRRGALSLPEKQVEVAAQETVRA